MVRLARSENQIFFDLWLLRAAQAGPIAVVCRNFKPITGLSRSTVADSDIETQRISDLGEPQPETP
ncbi:hypothetical protein B0G74_3833 [Paraburkholderia sp. BL9I2N2]|nr:hypothetical protein B0G74_3833 [Paraburkholderia sp. BL9I2N2]